MDGFGFTHKIYNNTYSNLYGYGQPDLMVPMSLPVNFTNIAKLQTTTNNYNNNAALNELNVLEVWKAGYTGSGTRIGIYDQTLGFSSITARHEFLNFTLSESAERDAHGFKVAQYATAQNHMPASVFGSGKKRKLGHRKSEMVSTPGARSMGWMQNGGHGLEVSA